jgi:hypothetical protein
MNQLNEEQQAIIKTLMMSQAMQAILHFAQTFPVNTQNPDELKTVFSVAGVQLIDALDNNRITFTDDEDRALLYGLLTAIFDYNLDGKLKEQTKILRAN